MNLDKVSEEEESDDDVLNRSFTLPDITLREAAPPSSKKSRRPGSSMSSSLRDSLDENPRPSSGSNMSRKSTQPPPPLIPPPGGVGSGTGSAPPPPPPPGVGPPPLAPPTDVDKKAVQFAPLKFNAKDLKLSRKKLRRAEEIMKMVDVERADMFDKYKKYKYMPLVDSREYLRTLRAEIVSISFDGIEQLTDAFLFSLHHCKLSLQSLRLVSLAGCYHITDEGVYWITLAFPTLRKMFLMGCRQLTEKALYYLLSSLKNLIHVDMTGTDVGIIPVDVPETTKLKVQTFPVVSSATSVCQLCMY